MKTTKSYYLETLGCPKNEVDAEAMTTLLQDEGFRFEPDPFKADFLILNTCAFIESAKTEAIQRILALSEAKEARPNSSYLIVTGCLAQRYAQDIYDELPEVDALLGTAQYHLIVECCRALEQHRPDYDNQIPPCGSSLKHLKCRHLPSQDRQFAWIKVAEGCSNGCSFCAIPGIRGKMISRPIEEIVEESKRLAEEGYKEHILIAQDTTRYGIDLYGKPRLADLIRELCLVPQIERLRLMYVYGDGINDELIHLMQKEPKLAHYLDLPIQHASNSILKAMRRRETREEMLDLIHRLREAIPDIVLRTTVMVGFPGETEEDFSCLMDFIQEVQFDRLGCFVYSPEEGTLAAKMENQVPIEIARNREKMLMEVQEQIAQRKAEARVGKEISVLIEGVSSDGLFFTGRSEGEAPDVDPCVFLAAQSEAYQIGDMIKAKVVEASAYDLTAVG